MLQAEAEDGPIKSTPWPSIEDCVSAFPVRVGVWVRERFAVTPNFIGEVVHSIGEEASRHFNMAFTNLKCSWKEK